MPLRRFAPLAPTAPAGPGALVGLSRGSGCRHRASPPRTALSRHSLRLCPLRVAPVAPVHRSGRLSRRLLAVRVRAAYAYGSGGCGRHSFPKPGIWWGLRKTNVIQRQGRHTPVFFQCLENRREKVPMLGKNCLESSKPWKRPPRMPHVWRSRGGAGLSAPPPPLERALNSPGNAVADGLPTARKKPAAARRGGARKGATGDRADYAELPRNSRKENEHAALMKHRHTAAHFAADVVSRVVNRPFNIS